MDHLQLHILWRQPRHYPHSTSGSHAVWKNVAWTVTSTGIGKPDAWAHPSGKIQPFQWIPLAATGTWQHLSLGTLLPTPPGEAPLVALPLAVSMGWTEAPPSFCAITKTATDLANWSLALGEPLKPHQLEQSADPSPTTEEGDVTYSLAPRDYASLPLSMVDAHVDDVIGATQGETQRCLHVTKAILHSVDKVF